MKSSLASICDEIELPSSGQKRGTISASTGSLLATRLEGLHLGELCEIDRTKAPRLLAQVVSFSENGAILAPFGSIDGIQAGTPFTCTGSAPIIKLPSRSTGGVFEPLGSSLGIHEEIRDREQHSQIALSLSSKPPDPLTRKPITKTLHTGIAAIDNCCPIGYGQRVGLFAGPGLGKSTLLGMIAKNAVVDRVVIARVGERGREVRDFVEDCLGEEGMKRSTLIVSTSDECALRRKLAAYSATRIAEYYRDRGERVLLLIDSITRTARAIRDISLAAGELPVRQGYTSSVYDELPQLVERAGTSARGSITAIYTILTQSDQLRDPLAEEMKSLLDGHIVLDRELAERGIYPAIDLTSSISRLFTKLFTSDEQRRARTLVRILTRLKKDKDLVWFLNSISLALPLLKSEFPTF